MAVKEHLIIYARECRLLLLMTGTMPGMATRQQLITRTATNGQPLSPVLHFIINPHSDCFRFCSVCLFASIIILMFLVQSFSSARPHISDHIVSYQFCQFSFALPLCFYRSFFFSQLHSFNILNPMHGFSFRISWRTLLIHSLTNIQKTINELSNVTSLTI